LKKNVDIVMTFTFIPKPPNGSVPEPATMSLVGLGMSGPAGALRRSRKEHPDCYFARYIMHHEKGRGVIEALVRMNWFR
jgi:hypothetical protein